MTPKSLSFLAALPLLAACAATPAEKAERWCVKSGVEKNSAAYADCLARYQACDMQVQAAYPDDSRILQSATSPAYSVYDRMRTGASLNDRPLMQEEYLRSGHQRARALAACMASKN